MTPPGRSQAPTRVRFLILGVLACGAGAAYLARVLSALAGRIEADFGLNATQLGDLFGLFQYGYVAVMLPAGWCVQKFGARRMLPLFACGWSAALLGIAAARDPDALAWGRVAKGVAQAGLMPALMQAVRAWFPLPHRGQATAVIAACLSLGAIAATGLSGLLLPYLNWRAILALYAAAGIGWAAACWVLLRDRPRDHPWCGPEEQALIDGPMPAPSAAVPAAQGAPPGARGAAWRLALNPLIWLICAQQFCRAFGMEFYYTWFPKYLTETRHLSESTSALLGTLPLLAVVLGALIGGRIMDRLLARTGNAYGSRSVTAAAALAACGACTALATLSTSTAAFVVVISAGCLLAGMASSNSWVATMEVAGPYLGVVSAVMNIVGNLGAASCPKLVGRLMDAYGTRPGGLSVVLLMLSGVAFAASAIWLFIRPPAAPRPAGA